jgi:hypothetical protein
MLGTFRDDKRGMRQKKRTPEHNREMTESTRGRIPPLLVMASKIRR